MCTPKLSSSCSSSVHNPVSVIHGVKKRRISSSSSGVNEADKKKEADLLSAMKEQKKSVNNGCTWTPRSPSDWILRVADACIPFDIPISASNVPSLKNGMPKLINSLRIPLPSNASYLEVGLIPKNDVFNVSVLVVIGTTFLLLNDVEMGELFTYLREQEEFRREVGGDEYFEAEGNEKGSFLMNKYGDDYEILHINRDDIITAVAFMTSNDLKNLLFKERFINEQIHRVRLGIDELTHKLDTLCESVRPLVQNNPYVEQILKYYAQTDGFAAEMLVNHIQFFHSALHKNELV